MFNATFDTTRAARLLRVGLTVLWVGLLVAVPARGQVSPEEHKKHHPNPGQAGPPGSAGPGMMGGKEGMGGMMEGMGKAPPKEQYPPTLTFVLDTGQFAGSGDGDLTRYGW